MCVCARVRVSPGRRARVRAGMNQLEVHHSVLAVHGACTTTLANLRAVTARANFDSKIVARFSSDSLLCAKHNLIKHYIAIKLVAAVCLALQECSSF